MKKEQYIPSPIDTTGVEVNEELSEAEKEYDRRTSMETLKVILSLGYRLTKE